MDFTTCTLPSASASVSPAGNAAASQPGAATPSAAEFGVALSAAIEEQPASADPGAAMAGARRRLGALIDPEKSPLGGGAARTSTVDVDPTWILAALGVPIETPWRPPSEDPVPQAPSFLGGAMATAVSDEGGAATAAEPGRPGIPLVLELATSASTADVPPPVAAVDAGTMPGAPAVVCEAPAVVASPPEGTPSEIPTIPLDATLTQGARPTLAHANVAAVVSGNEGAQSGMSGGIKPRTAVSEAAGPAGVGSEVEPTVPAASTVSFASAAPTDGSVLPATSSTGTSPDVRPDFRAAAYQRVSQPPQATVTAADRAAVSAESTSTEFSTAASRFESTLSGPLDYLRRETAQGGPATSGASASTWATAVAESSASTKAFSQGSGAGEHGQARRQAPQASDLVGSYVDVVRTLEDATLRSSGAADGPAGATAESQSAPSSDGKPLDTAVVKSLRILWQQGGGEARLRLQPEQFGDMTISLKVQGAAVVAVLHSDSATAREWLNTHQDELRRSLEDAGLSLDRLVVDADGHSQEQSSDTQGQHAPRQQRHTPTGTRSFEALL